MDDGGIRGDPNATAKTPTPEGQQLELWSPAREITNQIEVESEENQLDNAGTLRANSGNARRFKSRVLTWAEKSAEATMRQFAAQERQAEKVMMKEWKSKFMQEMAHELYIMRQTHGEKMKAQRQGFQIELEQIEQGFQNKLEEVGEKLEQVELRSKMQENEVRALRSPGQLATRNPPPTKAVTVSSSDNLNKRVEKQREDRRSEERNQEYQQAKTQATKASTPNQPKQTQSPTTSPTRKSYSQMAALFSPKVTTKNAWTEVTGSSRKQKANTLRKVEPEKRRVIFRRATTSPRKSEAD